MKLTGLNNGIMGTHIALSLLAFHSTYFLAKLRCSQLLLGMSRYLPSKCENRLILVKLLFKFVWQNCAFKVHYGNIMSFGIYVQAFISVSLTVAPNR